VVKFTTGRFTPGTLWIVGRVDSGVGVDTVVKRKNDIITPVGN